MLYQPLVFVHVASAFVFMLAHGASATVMYRLRHERNAASLRSLFAVRDAADMPFNASATVMFLSGIALAFMGQWWRAGWIWASLGTFLLITVVMSLLGRTYFEKARQLLHMEQGDKPATGAADADPAEIDAHLKSGRPHVLMGVGVGGFLLIVYFMMFKPF